MKNCTGRIGNCTTASGSVGDGVRSPRLEGPWLVDRVEVETETYVSLFFVVAQRGG